MERTWCPVGGTRKLFCGLCPKPLNPRHLWDITVLAGLPMSGLHTFLRPFWSGQDETFSLPLTSVDRFWDVSQEQRCLCQHQRTAHAPQPPWCELTLWAQKKSAVGLLRLLKHPVDQPAWDYTETKLAGKQTWSRGSCLQHIRAPPAPTAPVFPGGSQPCVAAGGTTLRWCIFLFLIKSIHKVAKGFETLSLNYWKTKVLSQVENLLDLSSSCGSQGITWGLCPYLRLPSHTLPGSRQACDSRGIWATQQE